MAALDAKLGDVLALVERLDTPLNPDVALRFGGEISLFPTDAETLEIRTNATSQEGPGRGIGVYPRGRPCSLFVWENMEEAVRTANYLADVPNLADFIKNCAVFRDLVNEEIFVFAFMSAFQTRKDTRHLPLPPVEEVLPYWYVPADVINTARRQVITAPDATTPIVVDYQFSGTQKDPEYALAYFREDIAINSHHWHWHLVYPFTWTPRAGEIKDRKGELFYFMHHEIMARYDAERLSNNLSRTIPFNDLNRSIAEGYSPRLLSTMSGTYYPNRPANMVLADVDVDAVVIGRLALWESRISESIHTNTFLTTTGTTRPLVDPEGINELGSMLESAATAQNRAYYGNYHNRGHVAISRVHDPLGFYGGDQGVMGFSATAMRDSVFYRWHKNIDDLFNEYKISLPPYPTNQLTLPGITLLNASLRGDASQTTNVLRTFWQLREIEISRGINFSTTNPVAVRFRHLQHEGFVHTIEVNNQTGGPKEVMVRLFMAPKFSEFQVQFQFDTQRRLFFQLDTYLTTLAPGRQSITRHSRDSSVTIPTARTFQQLANLPVTGLPDAQRSICGCGWPEHMLIPKGRPEGMTFTYFVMLTDGATDKVVQPTVGPCNDAASYCGLLNQLYPDKKPMGFPFDRRADGSILTIADFASNRPNMRIADVIIRHTGEIVGQDGVFQPAPVF